MSYKALMVLCRSAIVHKLATVLHLVCNRRRNSALTLPAIVRRSSALTFHPIHSSACPLAAFCAEINAQSLKYRKNKTMHNAINNQNGNSAHTMIPNRMPAKVITHPLMSGGELSES